MNRGVSLISFFFFIEVKRLMRPSAKHFEMMAGYLCERRPIEVISTEMNGPTFQKTLFDIALVGDATKPYPLR